ncbi:MAG: hypothetical protein AAGA53_01290 [Pseudomonadota bacterium]
MVLLYTILSICGICYLAVTNPKRRRAFDLAVLSERRWIWPARLSVIVPFLFLVFTANWSGLSIWAGAVTVLGWIVAATSPHQISAIKRVVARIVLEATARSSAAISNVLNNENAISGKLSLLASKQDLSKAKKKIRQLEGKIAKLEKKISEFEIDGKHAEVDDGPSLKIVKN